MKDLKIRIVQEEYMYHQVTASDHVIANTQLTLNVIYTKAVQY